MIRLIGDQHQEDIIVLGEQLGRYVKNRTFDKIIVDVRDMGYADVGARITALQLARLYHYDHVAFLRGTHSLNVALVLRIARRSGRVHDMQVFSTKAEAIRWLNTVDAGS